MSGYRRWCCPTWALAIALIAGCGRVGYDPVARVVDPDAGSRDSTDRDLSASDRTSDPPAAEADPPIADAGPLDVMSDAPLIPEAPVDASVEAPVDVAPPPADMAPAATPTGPGGTATCFAPPERRDLIADFDDSTLTLAMVDGRGGGAFHLVQTGAGVLTPAAAAPPQAACGSTLFMSLTGMSIPAGRNGHIQAQFRTTSGAANIDARAFSGLRLTMKADRALSVSLKLPDTNTRGDTPYDHFSVALNVTTSWHTYVIPFTSFRQSGVGTQQPALDRAALYAIELQVPDRDFSLLVDTIAFTR